MSETVDIIIREQGAEQAASNIEHVGSASEHASHQVHELEAAGEKLHSVLEAIGLGLTAAKLIEYADSYTSLINKLQQVTSSQRELVEVERELFIISQHTRGSFESTVQLYSALTKATDGLGFSSKDLMSVVQTINEGIKLEGKSTEEANGALRMFAFQLNQGELSGRGLRTMLVQFPTLARALASSLNVSSGALMEMGTRGELDSRRVMDAFQRIAPEVTQQFSKMQVTVGEAFHELESAVQRQIGMANQSSGATKLITEAMIFMAHHIQITMAVVGTLTTFLAVFTTGLLATSRAATTLWAVFAGHPLLLIASAIAAVISLFVKFGDQINLTSSGSVNALGLVVGVWRTLVDLFQFGVAVVQAIYAWFQKTDAATGAWSDSLAVLKSLLELTLTPLTNTIELVKILWGWFVKIADFLTGGHFSKGVDILSTKLSENIKKASEEMKKAALESDNMAGRTGTAFDSIGNSAGKMGSSVAAGAKAASDGLKNAFDDPNWGLKAYEKKMADLAAEAAKDFDEISKRNHDMAAKIIADQSSLRDALGNTITVTNEWARRSGEAFNNVSGSAKSSTSSISSSLSESSTAFTQWASAAEEAANRVIEANNAAASAAGQAAAAQKNVGTSRSGGGGGGDGFYYDAQGRPHRPTHDDPLGNRVLADNVDFGSPMWKWRHNIVSSDSAMAAEQAAQDKMNASRARPTGPTPSIGFASGGAFTVGGSGGTDSQMVQFLASPNETVRIDPPNQRESSKGSGGRPYVINMPVTVVAADIGSFKRSEKQIHQTLLGKLSRAQASLAQK